MKTKILLLATFIIFINSYSQISFSEQILLNTPGEADGAMCVTAADMDGDGDRDVLFSSISSPHKIAWYENMDGQGTFGPSRNVTANVNGSNYVLPIDVDGDGDLDIMSSGSNVIAWYENTDGLGNFSPQKVIANINYANSIYAADLDGDGDADVLASSTYYNYLFWYENLDGLGNYGTQQLISTNVNQAYSVFAADIDGDGDSDALSASWEDSKIAWYENTDSAGAFGAQQNISTSATSANIVYAADLDGDSDMDVISGEYTSGKIAWYKNADGMGTFNSEQIITLNAAELNSIFAIDLDKDGDIDLLSASRDPNRISWYENTNGLGDFGSQQIISTDVNVPKSVFACDIDNDGDLDVLSASIGNAVGDGKIALYKNTTPLSIRENSSLNFKVFPNPTDNVLYVGSKINILSIQVYDNLGKIVIENSNKQNIDISSLTQGLYFFKIIDANMNSEIKKIIKR